METAASELTVPPEQPQSLSMTSFWPLGTFFAAMRASTSSWVLCSFAWARTLELWNLLRRSWQLLAC